MLVSCNCFKLSNVSFFLNINIYFLLNFIFQLKSGKVCQKYNNKDKTRGGMFQTRDKDGGTIIGSGLGILLQDYNMDSDPEIW